MQPTKPQVHTPFDSLKRKENKRQSLNCFYFAEIAKERNRNETLKTKSNATVEPSSSVADLRLFSKERPWIGSESEIEHRMLCQWFISAPFGSIFSSFATAKSNKIKNFNLIVHRQKFDGVRIVWKIHLTTSVMFEFFFSFIFRLKTATTKMSINHIFILFTVRAFRDNERPIVTFAFCRLVPFLLLFFRSR